MEKLFTVEEIIARPGIDEKGMPTVVYEVTYVTKSGVRDTEYIPKADYNPKTVRQILEERAKIHEEIRAL